MPKRILEITDLSRDELVNYIQSLDCKIEGLKKYFQPKQPTELLSRKEVAAMFKVSLVTISDWTRKGLLMSYRMGNRVYYKRQEIDVAIVQIKHSK